MSADFKTRLPLICRCTDHEVSLEGSAEALSELAEVLTSKPLPFLIEIDHREQHTDSFFYIAARIYGEEGQGPVEISYKNDNRSLTIKGRRSDLETLAENIRNCKAGDRSHIEYFPGNSYLSEKSLPLVLDARTPNVEPPDIDSALYVERTAFRVFTAGKDDSPSGSRVGGAPPSALLDPPPTCPVCNGPVEYILTVTEDLLGKKVAKGEAISLLACKNFSCLLKAGSLIKPSPLLAVAHPDSPRSVTSTPIDSGFEGRRLVLQQTKIGRPTEDESTVGGTASYLQPRGAREEEKARLQGYDFLFQWSESSYRKDMSRGTDHFGFGTAYLFAPINSETGLPELKEISGFWLNT